jgi:hypothetical protein
MATQAEQTVKFVNRLKKEQGKRGRPLSKLPAPNGSKSSLRTAARSAGVKLPPPDKWPAGVRKLAEKQVGA